MFDFNFICSVLGIHNKKGISESPIKNFIIHSQNVSNEDCFIGLAGNRVDGGDFFEDALKLGAYGLILHKKHEDKYLSLVNQYPHTWAFFVDNVGESLILLSKKWRVMFHIPIIAITGSVGKTTTKELIKNILEKDGHNVCSTKNSENGTIGLPLTILTLRKEHSIAIFEIGIQKPGEMETLIDILQSITWTVITTILPIHILYFKTIENIIEEKLKLQYITKETIFIDIAFKKYINHKNIVSIGENEQADSYYHSMSTKISIEIKDTNKEYTINTLYHKGINHCIAIAFTVCYYLRINVKNIISAIENFKRVNGRFSIHHLKSGGIIINDCWNSGHASVMLKSIEAFQQFPTNKKKIMVLADMLEQGEYQEIIHNQIVEKINLISTREIEKIFYIGPSFLHSAKKNTRENIILAEKFIDITNQIYEYLDNKYCILFKGSNGMKLYYHINEYINKEKSL